MALKRLTVHLEPTVDNWIRGRAERSGKSINQELNDLLALLKGKYDQHQQRQAQQNKQAEIDAMKAKIAAIRNQKATPEGVAH
jgi:hypothetical protein